MLMVVFVLKKEISHEIVINFTKNQSKQIPPIITERMIDKQHILPSKMVELFFTLLKTSSTFCLVFVYIYLFQTGEICVVVGYILKSV